MARAGNRRRLTRGADRVRMAGALLRGRLFGARRGGGRGRARLAAGKSIARARERIASAGLVATSASAARAGPGRGDAHGRGAGAGLLARAVASWNFRMVGRYTRGRDAGDGAARGGGLRARGPGGRRPGGLAPGSGVTMRGRDALCGGAPRGGVPRGGELGDGLDSLRLAGGRAHNLAAALVADVDVDDAVGGVGVARVAVLLDVDVHLLLTAGRARVGALGLRGAHGLGLAHGLRLTDGLGPADGLGLADRLGLANGTIGTRAAGARGWTLLLLIFRGLDVALVGVDDGGPAAGAAGTSLKGVGAGMDMICLVDAFLLFFGLLVFLLLVLVLCALFVG